MTSGIFEDPRLRQRWNQISHTTEAVTENAAAGIWSFGHRYVNPCLSSLGSAIENCATPCFGDHEERARRRWERERTGSSAEYNFDFYDDWDEDLGGEDHGGFMGGWRGDDWDRLIGGTGRSKKTGTGQIHEQPRGRNRGMSYGTRGARRKSSAADDPTVIPSTQAIGFLGKLPFKIGGTLRYKPSAANLQEHPGAGRHEGENEPLLGHDDEYYPEAMLPRPRKRSGTAGSGDTSDSYRSRGDLFPSDEEGEEDAIPLDDEFAVALDRVDDRSSSRTKSSKGKRKAGASILRSGSRTTISSTFSRPTSLRQVSSPVFDADAPELSSVQSMEDLQNEESRAQREEDGEIERKRQAAAQLALERGLHQTHVEIESVPEAKAEMVEIDDIAVPEEAEVADTESPAPEPSGIVTETQPGEISQEVPGNEFVPARLPYFR